MKNDSLLVDGALGVFAGAMAWSLLGPGIIPAVMTAAGAGAMLYHTIKPKDQEWEVLCDNLGLCVDGLDKTTLYPKVLKRIKTDTGEKLWLTLPYGLTTLDFEKVRYRMEQFYDAEINIEYSNKKAIVEIHTKKLPEIIEFEPQKINPNEWIIGMRNDGTYETIQFGDNTAHMFAAGMKGYGKTTFLNINLLNANMQHNPEQVKYWIIDLKGGSELIPFADAKLTERFTWNTEEATMLLNMLVIEVNKRLKIRMQQRKKGLSLSKYPPIICVIDEYPNLVNVPEAFDALCYIARTARAVNIHLVLTTQRASREYIPGILKCNLAATVCFATKTEADSEVILGKGDYDGVLIRNKGRAVYDTPAKRVTVQVPFVDEKTLVKMLEPYIEKKTAQKPNIGVIKNDNRERPHAFGALRESQSNDIAASIFDTLSSSKTKRKNRSKKVKGSLR